MTEIDEIDKYILLSPLIKIVNIRNYIYRYHNSPTRICKHKLYLKNKVLGDEEAILQ